MRAWRQAVCGWTTGSLLKSDGAGFGARARDGFVARISWAYAIARPIS